MTTRESSAGAAVLGALAAARALDDDGQYSAAKLFRAAAVGQALRATRNRSRDPRDREQAMAEAALAWRAARGNDGLAAALDRAVAAVGAGQPWLTLEEAPRPFVCRDCGEVALGEPPAACPTCGARGLTFREIPATHFLEPLDVDVLIETLRGTPAEVDRLCAGVDEDRAHLGAWPPRDIVRHLILAERMLTGRAWRILEEDEPFLGSVAPPVAAADGQTLADLVAEFRAGRARTLDRAAGLTSANWERAGIHPEWGRVTLRQQLGYMARHEQSHLAELEASCRAARSGHG